MKFRFGMKAAIALLLTLIISSSWAASNKPVVAVGEITSAVQEFNTMSIQLAIENALAKTGKYTMMERTRLDTLLQERGLSAAGITEGDGSLSGFSGVDYLVYGSVSNITVASKNLFIMMNCDASVSMNIRVVDVSSGEIRFSENVTIEKTVGTSPTEEDPCSGISLSNLNVIGEDASDGIANKMTTAIFPIKVARARGDEVYLNYGEGTLSKSDILSIKEMGEGFVDPDTGEVLGAEETTTAVIVVVDVRTKFSIGEIVAQSGAINAGDIAYPLDGKSSAKQAKKCQKSSEKKEKDCAKGGKRCEKSNARMKKDCGALMEL
ncbi:MAG: CsgG/HfaB family protein [Actinomycetota bacterium]|nr:CsgG/HfaB family protein [Actinomycetota bacterium]